MELFQYYKEVNCKHSPDQCKNEQLLRIEGEFGGEVGEEQSSHSVRILEPHGQQAEDCCTADRRKEAAPVVAHREVCGGNLNAEEDACKGFLLFVLALSTLWRKWGVQGKRAGLVLLTTNGSSKTGAHTDGAGSSQHFRVAGLILIDALEWCDEFT